MSSKRLFKRHFSEFYNKNNSFKIIETRNSFCELDCAAFSCETMSSAVIVEVQRKGVASSMKLLKNVRKRRTDAVRVDCLFVLIN